MINNVYILELGFQARVHSKHVFLDSILGTKFMCTNFTYMLRSVRIMFSEIKNNY